MRAYPCELSALINKLAQPAKTIFTDFDVFQENSETRLLLNSRELMENPKMTKNEEVPMRFDERQVGLQVGIFLR